MTASNSKNEAEAQTPSKKAEETTYHIQEDESVTETVVRAVCSVTQSDQMGLTPLYSIIDTDALNALFTSHINGHSRQTDAVVAFKYAGNLVQVTGGEYVTITETPPEENVPDNL